ncbi:recombinase family protein [Candidatus Daviesbacteria bacterium]|nr:recombinase family protein [Candidatus Daviesbacteria bacterium]
MILEATVIDTCVIYSRKSLEDKTRQILSLEDQLNACSELIESNNLNLVAPPFSESKSAKKAGVRVEFYKMVNLIKTGKAKIIVTWEASRLARNSVDGGQIIDLVDNYGLKIITPYTTFDTTNSFMLWIEFGQSTDFSKKLSVNVKRGLKSKIEKGIAPIHAPLGYRNTSEKAKGEKEIVEDPAKWDLVRKWWDLMLSGTQTVESSLEIVTAMGLKGIRGEKVSKTTAYKTFRRIFYTGFFYVKGELYQGIHKPMITIDEFERIQKLLDKKHKQNPTRIVLPFQGFIKCSCGATITGEKKTKFYKETNRTAAYVYYRCTRKLGPCKQPAINSGELDIQIMDYLTKFELNSQYIEWVKEVVKRRGRNEVEAEKKIKENKTKRLNQISDMKMDLWEMKKDGLITEDEYIQKKNKILKEQGQVQQVIANDNFYGYLEKVLDDALDFAANLQKTFNKADPLGKKLIVQAFGSNLLLKDKKLEIEPKSIFIFLRKHQNQVNEGVIGSNLQLERQNSLNGSQFPQVSYGAGEGS